VSAYAATEARASELATMTRTMFCFIAIFITRLLLST
jgi:hypothetical protein